MTPQALRRLKSLVPTEGVFIDADRARRLYDATSADLSDEERIAVVKSVLRMLADPGAVTG